MATEIEFRHDIYDTVRKNIKRYRLQKNMTAQELADLVEMSHDYLRQIESEKVARNFSFDMVYRISVALGVTLDMLIEKEIKEKDNEEGNL